MPEKRRFAVTGWTGTIGSALVAKLLSKGATVHAVGRSRADSSAQSGLIVHEVDLRDSEAIAVVLDRVDVDVLVNAAGLGSSPTRFDHLDFEYVDDLFQVNALAVFHVMRAVLPSMVERGNGHVVTIGSIAGSYPVGASVYAASKAAVSASIANLRIEFEGSGVKFTEIRPGRIRSALFEKSGGPDHAKASQPVDVKLLEPEDVVAAIEFAIDVPRHVNVTVVELISMQHVVGGSYLVT